MLLECRADDIVEHNSLHLVLSWTCGEAVVGTLRVQQYETRETRQTHHPAATTAALIRLPGAVMVIVMCLHHLLPSQVPTGLRTTLLVPYKYLPQAQ